MTRVLARRLLGLQLSFALAVLAVDVTMIIFSYMVFGIKTAVYFLPELIILPILCARLWWISREQESFALFEKCGYWGLIALPAWRLYGQITVRPPHAPHLYPRTIRSIQDVYPEMLMLLILLGVVTYVISVRAYRRAEQGEAA